MKVDYYIIKEMLLDGKLLSDEEIAADPTIREKVRHLRYSLTSLCAGDNHKLYVGCTNSGGDILQEFDTQTGKFRSLEFGAIREPNDHKIHRGLWLDRQRNSLFFGLATLAPLGKVCTGPGARLIRYDLTKGEFEDLGRPWPGSYIQATVYDDKRQMMYAFTLPGLGMSVTDLKSRQTRYAAPVESIVHISALDGRGGVWGTHSTHLHAFFRYLPDEDQWEFPEKFALPTAVQGANVMYAGAGPVDSMIYGPDGWLYIGTALGEIYRMHPESREIEYLCRPFPCNRLQGLRFIDGDDRLFGVGGDRWQSTLFALDVRTKALEKFGQIVSPDGRVCYRPHDLVYQDGRFYVAETDNPKMSGVLWALTI